MNHLQAKDACELLDADHVAVKHLFVEYARLAVAPAQDPRGERHAIALKICDEITVHARIEEEIFYPELRSVLLGEDELFDEAEKEHDEAKALIAEIRSIGKAGPELDDKVSELNRAIEHHVKEERDEIFPKARAAQGLDLDAMGDRLRDRRSELA